MNEDTEKNVINKDPPLNILSTITLLLLAINDKYQHLLGENIYQIINYIIPFLSSGIFYLIKIFIAKFRRTPIEITYEAYLQRNIKKADKMIEHALNNPNIYTSHYLEDVMKRKEELLLETLTIGMDRGGKLITPSPHTE